METALQDAEWQEQQLVGDLLQAEEEDMREGGLSTSNNNNNNDGRSEEEELRLVRSLGDTGGSSDEEEEMYSARTEDFVVNKRNTKFQAELKLLRAIEQPRKELGKGRLQRKTVSAPKPWLTPAQVEREELAKPKYLEMPKTELEKFRPKMPYEEKTAANNEDVEKSKVQTLPRQVKIAESSTGLVKLKTTTKSRQLRHDEALRLYKDKVIEISEELETQVINKGRELREALGDVDAELARKVEILQVDDQLRMEDYEFLTTMWDTLETLCRQRRQVIEDFDDQMEAVERTRSERVGTELRTLVDSLIEISYKLRGDVERLVEREAHDVNVVLISNLKVKGDLVARMLKKNVVVAHSTKRNWERAELRWRQLRHERALEEWTLLIMSKEFVDPEERIDIVQRAAENQRERHAKERLELLEELKRLVPSFNPETDQVPLRLPTLSGERIADIRQRLEDLDKREDDAVQTTAEALEEQRTALLKRMEHSREALRGELHLYAALAERGDIFTFGERGAGRQHRVRLGTMIADTTLEEFFRKSGGLKHELASIVSGLGKPGLIYNDQLELLLGRVALIAESSRLAEIKANEGKLTELKALEGTLEKLRVAKKAELAPLVPVLFRQTLALKTSESLGPHLVAEIDLALDALESVQPTLGATRRAAEAVREGEVEDVLQDGDNNKHTSEDSAIMGSGKNTGEGDEEDEDEYSEEPMDSAELAYKERPLNLTELRNAQKRIGSVVHASNLSKDIIAEVCSCQETLNCQQDINVVVDAVVGSHCDKTITQRNSDVAAERERIVAFFKEQRDRLKSNVSNICDFFTGIATLLVHCTDTEEKTDMHFEQALDHLEDRFDEDNAALENSLKATVDSLRHAPDRASLERFFAEALDTLASIDTAYRAYHRDGVQLSREHPRQAETQAQMHHDQISDLFGLKQLTHVSELAAIEDESRHGAQQLRMDAASIPPNTPENEMQQEENAQEGSQAGEIDKDQETQENDEDQEDQQVGVKSEAEETKEDGDISTKDLELGQSSEESEELEQTVPQETKQVTPEEEEEEEDIDETHGCNTLVFSGEFRFEQVRTCEQLACEMLLFKPKRLLQDGGEESDDDDDHDDVIHGEEPEQGGQGEHQFDDLDLMAKGESQDIARAVSEDAENVDDEKQDELSGAVEAIESDSEVRDAVKEHEMTSTDVQPAPPQVVLERIAIDESFTSDLVLHLRNAVLWSTSESRRKRTQEMETVCEERCEEFTEELEERLRLHWPRKGRTDVMFQQPRAGELLQHQQRHDRHVRSVNLRNTAQAQQFARKLEKMEQTARKFRQFMNGLTLHLEAQGNVAALQGIFKRGKDTIAKFQAAVADQKEALMPFVRRSNDLMDMNHQFLSTCIPFEQGGDYNREEVALEQESLQKVEDVLLQDLNGRAERLQALFSEIRETRTTFSAKFQADFDRCLQALSVREGLGRKYGAPRRNAQEKLRSEIAVSDNAEQFVDEQLALLRARVMRVKDPEYLVNDQKEDKALSEQIKSSVDLLRKCMWRRAKYLEFFVDIDKVPIPEPVELQDLATDQGGEADHGVPDGEVTLKAGTSAERDATFSRVIRLANDQCQKETRELYEREGMLDELEECGKRLAPDGELLPESLVNFLRDFEQRGLKYREDASRRLRDQVNDLLEILLEGPLASLTDILMRTQSGLQKTSQALEQEFDACFRDMQDTKRAHENMLRPSIGGPNNAGELQKLCESETQRTEAANAKIIEVFERLVAAMKQGSANFVAALVHSTTSLLKLLDTLVSPVDFETLPGDSLVVTKRMGLRKLRKARLRGEQQATNGAGADQDKEHDRRPIPHKRWEKLSTSRLDEVLKTFQEFEKNPEAVQGTDAKDGLGDGGAADSEGGNNDPVADPEEHEAGDQDRRETIESLKTPQHRAVIAAQEELFTRFVSWCEAEMRKTNHKYSALLHAETRWATYWTTSIKRLQSMEKSVK